jgi:hypothetical protein
MSTTPTRATGFKTTITALGGAKWGKSRITAAGGAKSAGDKTRIIKAVEAESLVLIALCEVLIPFGAILTRFHEILTPFGLVRHPTPNVSLREILGGLLEPLPRPREVLSRLIGLLPRLAEVVPRLAELGGGSVIAHSVHVDSRFSSGCPRLPHADARVPMMGPSIKAQANPSFRDMPHRLPSLQRRL